MVVKGSPNWPLSRLIDKCLVKVDLEGNLSMHDLIRDMGRNVVMQSAPYKPEMQSHVWDPTVAAKILQKKKCSDEILALSAVGLCNDMACEAQQYARMRELRYLVLDGCPVNGDFSEWSEESRWLRWRYFSHSELPLSLKLPDLAVLDLANSHCLSCVWAGDFELKFPCKELRMLIPSNCTKLKELPLHIHKLLKLKSVNLEGCSSLKSLSESLGNLTELEYLNVSCCSSLTSLPNSIVNLLKLREMHVVACYGLRKLILELGRLKSMEVFKASSLFYLEELPESFGQLQSLKEVAFNDCWWLGALSENFSCLGSLQKLNLCHCMRLTKLPESFSDLCNLQELNLIGCKLLQELPPHISRLKKMRVLHLKETALEELPDDSGLLTSLREADFKFCNHLQKLCDNFGCLTNLRKLFLSRCGGLNKLPNSFSDLYNLEELDLCGCKLLQKLPLHISRLKKLRVLCIGATELKELPEDFGLLQSLAKADFEYCQQLQKLCENFGCLSHLWKLNLSSCVSLTKLPDSFSNLSNLLKLNLSNCTTLQMLPPSMGRLKKLVKLELFNMTWDKVPEDFRQLTCEPDIEFIGLERLRDLCPPELLRNYFADKLSRLDGRGDKDYPDLSGETFNTP